MKPTIYIVAISLLASLLVVYARPQQKCEVIDKDVICQCRGYNLTYFPNDRFTSQNGAKIQFSQFDNLIRTNCSPHLVPFLCSRYFPPCNPYWGSFNYILPCRELCETVKKDCEPVLLEFGAQWSEELSCDKFQSINDTKPNGPPCISTERMSTSSSTDKCSSKEKCVDIDHPKGESLNANYKTFFPNTATVTSSSASEKLNKVLKNKCSLDAERFFLISHYPSCTEANDTVHLLYPCKQLCRKVKRECEEQVGAENLVWPDYLDCRKLPKHSCIEDISLYFDEPSPTTTSVPAVTSIQLPTATPTVEPLKSCKQFIESRCDELNKFPDLPIVKYLEDNATYAKFLNSKCSVWLKPFLCYEVFSAYNNDSSNERVRPCKNVCRKAKNECEPCFTQHNITWDDHWDCKDFQIKGKCIGVNELVSYSKAVGKPDAAAVSCPEAEASEVCTP